MIAVWFQASCWSIPDLMRVCVWCTASFMSLEIKEKRLSILNEQERDLMDFWGLSKMEIISLTSYML